MQERLSTRVWDNYWRSSEEAAAYAEGGPQQNALQGFWQDFFKVELHASSSKTLLDVACGNGAIINSAQRLAAENGAEGFSLTALDYSVPAITELQKRYDNVHGVVANAASMPFSDASFNLVCSQFGVEYAGKEAIRDAARLVAPNGVLATVLHYKEGAIHQECLNNKNAINAILKSRVLPLFRSAFETGVAVSVGKKSANKFKIADRKLAPAVETAKGVLAKFGANIASGGIQRLLVDMGHMYQKIESFEPAQVYQWTKRMDKELNAYKGRMSAMLNAGLDRPTMEDTKQTLVESGFNVRQMEPLLLNEIEKPIAWILVAEKR